MKPLALVAGYLVRYPLGGHVMSQLHFLVGLQQMGYEVVFIEHFGWPYSCFLPPGNTMTSDPLYGIARIHKWLKKYGITKWCYIDEAEKTHGLTREEVKRLCQAADVLISI